MKNFFLISNPNLDCILCGVTWSESHGSMAGVQVGLVLPMLSEMDRQTETCISRCAFPDVHFQCLRASSVSWLMGTAHGQGSGSVRTKHLGALVFAAAALLSGSCTFLGCICCREIPSPSSCLVCTGEWVPGVGVSVLWDTMVKIGVKLHPNVWLMEDSQKLRTSVVLFLPWNRIIYVVLL